MNRGAYLDELKRLSTALGDAPGPSAHARAAYLSRLVDLAARLPLDVAPDDSTEADRLVHEVLAPRAQDILWRVAGVAASRRRALGQAGRRALRELGTSPDLLGPLGDERNETSHSAALGYFLNPKRSGELGHACLAAFTTLLLETDATDQPLDLPDTLDLGDAVVTTERDLGDHGRVDVSIDATTALVFVEVKVDAEAEADQLSKYAQALHLLAGSKETMLVFLTVKPEQPANTKSAHRHITFRDVLRAWLPVASDHRSTYLAMYLKTIAVHLERVADAGGFDEWRLDTQGAALNFLEKDLEA